MVPRELSNPSLPWDRVFLLTFFGKMLAFKDMFSSKVANFDILSIHCFTPLMPSALMPSRLMPSRIMPSRLMPITLFFDFKLRKNLNIVIINRINFSSFNMKIHALPIVQINILLILLQKNKISKFQG